MGTLWGQGYNAVPMISVRIIAAKLQAKIQAGRTMTRQQFLSNTGLPILLLILAWITVGDLATNPNHLPGIDTYWHVTLIDEGADRIRDGEPLVPISETINAGTRYLFDTDGTYPQFVYWVSIFVALITGNAGTAYGLLMFAAIAVAQLSFYFGFRSRVGNPGALVGAIAFAYAPFTLTAVAPEGRYPALLAVSTTPLILAGGLSLIDAPSRRIWILGTGAAALSVGFHAMVFYIAIIPIVFILGLYALNSKKGPKRLALAGSIVFAGVLVAWILLPDGISDFSESGGVAGVVAASSESVGGRADTGTSSDIVPFSIRWNSFDVGLRSSNLNYAGLGLAIAGILTMVLVRRRDVFIFGTGAIFAYVLATGSITPFWDQIPLATRLEPRRFLFPAYLGVSVVIAIGFSNLIDQMMVDRSRKTVAIYGSLIVVVCGLILFDSIPMAKRIAPIPDDQRLEWTTALVDQDIDGRLFWNSGSGFATYYFGGRETGLEVTGRYRSVDQALRSGFPQTAITELALLNTRAVLTDEHSFEALPKALQNASFEEVARWDSRVLLVSAAPSSIFMNQTVDAGLIGVAGTGFWSKIFPNSVPIDKPDLVPEELLKSIKIIVLSAHSFSDVSKVENVLSDYVRAGGRVILEEPNLSGPELFDSRSRIDDVPPEFSVSNSDGNVDVLPFSADGQTFRGVYYESDSAGEVTFSGTTPDGQIVPLVTKRTFGDGAIYLVCCNIGNHIVGTSDQALAKAVREYFGSEIGTFRSNWPTSFNADYERVSPSHFELTYESESDTPILISLIGINNRSLVTESGDPIQIVKFGPISAAVLPKGEHTIVLKPRSNLFQAFPVSVWFIGLALAGTILSFGWTPLARAGNSYAEVAASLARTIFTIASSSIRPLWAGTLDIPGGTLYSDSPKTTTSFEMSSDDADTVEVVKSDDNGVVVSLYLSVEASTSETLTFAAEELCLRTTEGRVVEADSSKGSEMKASPQFALLSLIGKRSRRLANYISLQNGDSQSGYVVFKLNGTEKASSLFLVGNPSDQISYL